MKVTRKILDKAREWGIFGYITKKGNHIALGTELKRACDRAGDEYCHSCSCDPCAYPFNDEYYLIHPVTNVTPIKLGDVIE